MPPRPLRALLSTALTGLCLMASACSLSSSGQEPDESSAPSTYVALGDSFTAAPGVPTTELLSGCAGSSGSYPGAVAAQLSMTLVDASCGGATTESLTEPQVTGAGPVPPSSTRSAPARGW